MFAGHTKVLVGSYVARGPDVAQAWSRGSVRNKSLCPFTPLLQEFRKPPIVPKNTFWAHLFIFILRGPQNKKG